MGFCLWLGFLIDSLFMWCFSHSLLELALKILSIVLHIMGTIIGRCFQTRSHFLSNVSYSYDWCN